MFTMPFICNANLEAICDDQNGQSCGSAAVDRLTFDDSNVAYEILKKLDIYEGDVPKDPSYSPANYNKSFWGLKPNRTYCDAHRKWFVNNTEEAFTKLNFFTDFWPSRPRNVTIPELGADLHPEIGFELRRVARNSIDLSPALNVFFTSRKMCLYREIGVQFSCLTQMSNKVTNNDDLIKKDDFTFVLNEYMDSYKSRPQCLGQDEYFPRAWVMYDRAQCKAFFKEFNDPSYFELKKTRGVVYMHKLADFVHMGEGVFPVDEPEEVKIRQRYDNGTKCGLINDHSIMQYLVPDPLLLENRKFDFRIFLFVASTNPVIAYYYDGNLKVSLHEYDVSSTEPGVFITNIALSYALFEEAEKNGTYKGMTSQELKSKTHWDYNDFITYLLKTGQVTDPNWLDNYLRREMKKLLVHVTRITQNRFEKKSSQFEVYGVDLVIDKDFKLWYIESNQKPLIEGWTPEIVPYFDKMLKDHFEVTFGLLKSRMKRIIRFVNEIIRDKDSWVLTNNGIAIDNLRQKRKEFQKISMNYFEPEYRPSPQNGFQLIVDENVSGEGRYFGLTEECY